MRDERTTQVLQRIHSEMMVIMILMCALSMAIKVLFFEKGLSDCMLEWIVLVGSPVYQMIRARMLKVSLGNGALDLKRTFKSTLLSLVTILVIFGITAVLHPEKMTFGFALNFLIPYVIVFFVLRVVFSKMEERHARKLEEEYDE